MNRQVLDVELNKPIVIETPMGFIHIREIKVKDGRGRKHRRVEMLLPPGLTANRGEERAKQSARFVEMAEDGRVRPKYEVLVPELDHEGNLVGVKMPTPICCSGV